MTKSKGVLKSDQAQSSNPWKLFYDSKISSDASKEFDVTMIRSDNYVVNQGLIPLASQSSINLHPNTATATTQQNGTFYNTNLNYEATDVSQESLDAGSDWPQVDAESRDSGNASDGANNSMGVFV